MFESKSGLLGVSRPGFPLEDIAKTNSKKSFLRDIGVEVGGIGDESKGFEAQWQHVKFPKA